MKKILLSVLLVLFSLSHLVAQDATFVKGDKVLNLGIGFGGLYSGSYYTTSVPPISASFEVGVKDGIIDKGSIGVGGLISYSSHKWEYSGWGWKYTNIIIGAKGSFHYPLLDKLDTYSGVVLGYNIATSSEFGNSVPGYDYNASSGGLSYAWFAGARYYFSEKFAAMAELGVGITYLNVGIAIKL